MATHLDQQQIQSQMVCHQWRNLLLHQVSLDGEFMVAIWAQVRGMLQIQKPVCGTDVLT